jgi:ketosteroid isomerase-like protein
VKDVATRNEQQVRNLFATHNRGAEEVLGALDDIFDPQVEWTPAVIGGLEGGSYQGYEGIRRYYADRAETFAEGQVQVLSTEPVGHHAVVAKVRSSGVGRVSGASLEQQLWMGIRLRDGRILRWRACSSRREALEAASA